MVKHQIYKKRAKWVVGEKGIQAPAKANLCLTFPLLGIKGGADKTSSSSAHSRGYSSLQLSLSPLFFSYEGKNIEIVVKSFFYEDLYEDTQLRYLIPYLIPSILSYLIYPTIYRIPYLIPYI
jgi:hypothetical protein